MTTPATGKGFDPSELDFEQTEDLKDFPASPAASGSLNKPAFKIGAMTFNRKLIVGLSIFLAVAGGYSLLNGLSTPAPKKGAGSDEKKPAPPPAENYVRPPDMVNDTPGTYKEMANKAAESNGQGQAVPSMGVPAVPTGAGNIFVPPSADPRYPQYTPGQAQPGGDTARQYNQNDANDVAAERRRAVEQRRQDAIDKRRQTIENARKSGILFKFAGSFLGSSAQAAEGSGGIPPSMIDPSSVLKQFSGIVNASQGSSPVSAPAAAAVPGSGSRDANANDSRLLYMQQTRTTPATMAQIQEPNSPYEIKAGVIIPALLQTGINSDLPGNIVARVRENVYDTATGHHLLIPMGSTLIGDYDSKIMWGQNRLLAVWTRIIFRDGSSIDLGNLPGVDMRGQAGLSDQVDNHWGRILSSVVMSTALAAGTKVAAGQPSSTEQTQSSGQLAASGASESLVQSGQQLFAKNLQISPTLKIRQGHRFNILVQHDIILRPYRR